jgi:hypothetical protein
MVEEREGERGNGKEETGNGFSSNISPQVTDLIQILKYLRKLLEIRRFK